MRGDGKDTTVEELVKKVCEDLKRAGYWQVPQAEGAFAHRSLFL
jgi:hypothetical protein